MNLRFEDDDDLKKAEEDIAASEKRAERAALLGGVGDALASGKSFGHYFLGQNPVKRDVSGYFDKKAQMERDKIGRIKGLMEKYQASKAARAAKLEDRRYQEDRDAKKFEQDKELALLKQQAGKTNKMLSENTVKALASARQVPDLLNDLGKTVDANKDTFGPVAGRWASVNPWNETAKTVDAQVRTVRQTVGKLKEGGVLRAEDEIKYAKMLPELSDTPEVAKNKIALVRREMMRDMQNNLSSLALAGYDVSPFADAFQQDIPNLPGAVQGKGGIKTALAGNKKEAPYGQTVVQNGHTYTWNPEKGEYE